MKNVYFIIVNVLVTVGTSLMLLQDSLLPFFLWLVISLLAWILLGVSNSSKNKTTSNDEEERVEEESNKISGYEKSGLEIKGCYNCIYSKDIDNNTFVECKKHQQKVYRHNICDTYKS